MDPTYEQMVQWLDNYFEEVNSHQGWPEDVAQLSRWFAPDFRFMMYTPPEFVNPPLSRQELLMLFVHPGITENLVPRYYVVDLRNKKVVVQFEIRFVDDVSGRVWPPKQASAHYQFTVDDDGRLLIASIEYWTEKTKAADQDDWDALYAAWGATRERGLTEHALKSF